MRRAIDVISVCLVAGIALVAAYVFCDSCRGATIFALGRSNGCSLGQTVAAMNEQSDIAAIRKQVRLVRKDNDLELWATPSGEFWMPVGEEGEAVSQILYELGQGAYGAGETGVRSGDVVIDCGGHIGTFSRAALGKGAAKVVAIEPTPRNIECLRRNFVKEIADGRFVIYEKGAWDSETTLEFRADDGNSARGSFFDRPMMVKPHMIQVPVTMIDKIVAELNLPKVDFIKMDIEGSERRALGGAKETLSKFHPRLAIAAYHTVGDYEAITAMANAAFPGYRRAIGMCERDVTSMLAETALFY